MFGSRAQRIQNLAYALIQTGIKPGDTVAYIAPNTWVLHFSQASSGPDTSPQSRDSRSVITLFASKMTIAHQDARQRGITACWQHARLFVQSTPG